jgi:glycosyltransferase involved in cell wall biosynthesis
MIRPPAGVSVVVPTVGRPSLDALVRSLGDLAAAPVPVELLTVDGRGRGPAAARNAGWRAARHEWVVFLDDDVIAEPDWLPCLIEDLTVDGTVGGVQGRVTVPVPSGRRPTDWERVTAGLADGAWITADMAYRRAALAQVGGFDERFPRAFREDAELASRIRSGGWQLLRGRRTVVHPGPPGGAVGQRPYPAGQRRRRAAAAGCTGRTGGPCSPSRGGGGRSTRRSPLPGWPPSVCPALPR